MNTAHWIISFSGRCWPDADGYPIDSVVCSSCGTDSGGISKYCKDCGSLMNEPLIFPDPQYPPEEWRELSRETWRKVFNRNEDD